MEIPINHFDRSKPFYPLVMSYLLQYHGLKELAVRGVLGRRNITDTVFEKAFPELQEASSEEKGKIQNNLKTLLGPLDLKTSHGDRIKVEADQVAKEIKSNFNYLLPHVIRSTGSLIILAHENTKGKSYRDKGPLWEFLRHCRNAATHNGLFDFRGSEPKRLAQWKNLTITSDLQDHPLFKNDKGHGFLYPGDPIRLLWDIEQTYPDMSV
ncbi:hypothetical protein [Gracilimonas mengyeensis]|uniref:Uncharacterized protein n=1 Tax=Gracilimonas mengyeensis TaxID=1302730 RepID=A0A521CLP7_9BACT|nr:hypothetical protein [Gracilimonas mengyeensis]SMO60344.1 hypothetical protein SAMN06265219_10611 [Gracilimonas mengyeensis]